MGKSHIASVNSGALPNLPTGGLCSSSSPMLGCSSGPCCTPARGHAKPEPRLMSSLTSARLSLSPAGWRWTGAAQEHPWAPSISTSQDICKHTETPQNPQAQTFPKLTPPILNYHPSCKVPWPLIPSGMSLGWTCLQHHRQPVPRDSLRACRNGLAAFSISTAPGLCSPGCRHPLLSPPPQPPRQDSAVPQTSALLPAPHTQHSSRF